LQSVNHNALNGLDAFGNHPLIADADGGYSTARPSIIMSD